ncbi:guanylate cyclase protein [Trichomonas vaginalis G3]|uniref:guanylate cyclase protein n=1 Tax=Trichomonas vaginalis (strain ATCC PRA-98 / G3) TaxID=412133 RepID=UPI0021E52DC1|nr:guanylate cyclase protein [Trichomonas vaginalis G3]KAI5482962.1 guanylate cyclase protein [Trichomonas vaginalis G3]
MAANLNSFVPGTFTFKVMSVLTVFFHLIPLQYRRGNGWIILYVVNSLLIIFGIYLVVVAFKFKKSSKVSNFSTIALSIYLAIGPFLFVPISAQYCGQILSGYISKDVATDVKSSIAVATSAIAILMWMWIIIKAYSISLVFRQVSFQSIEELHRPGF